MIPIDASGKPLTESAVTGTVPGRSHQRVQAEHEFSPDFAQVSKIPDSRFHLVKLNLDAVPEVRRYRLVFSGWKQRVRVGGISFDESPLHWPWRQKSKITLMHRSWEVGRLSFSFDPARLLPSPLNSRRLEVLNDCGSSVLLRIARH